MRRAATAAAVLALALAGSALAAGSAKLTIDPNEAGKGTVATIDATPPSSSKNPSSVVLQVVKGVGVHPAAVAKRCTNAQAGNNSCPRASRIGGGNAEVTVTGFGKVTATIKLYLGRKQKPGDIAGVVGIATAGGQTAHAIGRVRHIDRGRLGVETRFDHLDKALKPPPGIKAHVDHIHLHFGTHRRVNGKRVDLITNPKTCTPKGWPYRISVRYPDGTGQSYHSSVTCSQ